jgi:hypothetical protein
MLAASALDPDGLLWHIGRDEADKPINKTTS